MLYLAQYQRTQKRKQGEDREQVMLLLVVWWTVRLGFAKVFASILNMHALAVAVSDVISWENYLPVKMLLVYFEHTWKNTTSAEIVEVVYAPLCYLAMLFGLGVMVRACTAYQGLQRH